MNTKSYLACICLSYLIRSLRISLFGFIAWFECSFFGNIQDWAIWITKFSEITDNILANHISDMIIMINQDCTGQDTGWIRIKHIIFLTKNTYSSFMSTILFCIYSKTNPISHKTWALALHSPGILNDQGPSMTHGGLRKDYVSSLITPTLFFTLVTLSSPTSFKWQLSLERQKTSTRQLLMVDLYW